MQQINFCNAIKKPGRYAINAKTARTLLNIWIVFLLVVSIVQGVYAFFEKGYLAYAQRKEKNISENIHELIRVSPAVRSVADLYNSIDLYASDITKQSIFSKEITVYDTKNTMFYPSEYFTQLSEAILPNIWLTKIDFAGDGKAITLEGFTYSPALLIKFVATLQNEPVFKDKPFRTVHIVNSADLDKAPFTISTQDMKKT